MKINYQIGAFKQVFKQPQPIDEKGRHERKFVIDKLDIKQIATILKLHPAGFSEIYQKRQVNNIYLDSRNLDAFEDNAVGNSNRNKIRIRWYGETFGKIDKPVLEFKSKKGLAGTKSSYDLVPFTLDNTFTRNTLSNVFERSEIPDLIRQTLTGNVPVLVNNYKRQYYLSFDRKIRITLDADMTYYKIADFNNNFIQFHVDRSSIILEIKYMIEFEKIAADISSRLPVRMTKSSKYINGIELLH